MDLDGWHPDPFGTHQERLFREGEPTALVRDNGVGSYDRPRGLHPRTLNPASQAASMAEEEEPTGPSGGPPAIRPVGWYRDKDGQRRFWNGVAWVDISRAITSFTVGSEKIAEPPEPPPVAQGRSISKRTEFVAAAVAVVVVVAAAIGATNETPVRLSVSGTNRSTHLPPDTAPLLL